MKAIVMMTALLLFSAGRAIALDVPLAVVISIEGQGDISASSGETTRAAQVGEALAAGEVLQVRKGKITLLRQDGRVQPVSAGSSIRIETPVRGARSQGSLGRLWETLANRARNAFSPRQRYSDAGAVRTDPLRAIDLISPRNTALLAAPARIAWLPAAGTGSYLARVSDGNGSVVWSATTSGSALEIPASCRLEPGLWYFVSIRDSRRGGPVSDEAFFRILPAPEQVRVREDVATMKKALGPGVGAATEALAIGSVYEAWDLVDEALATLRSARVKDAALSDAIRFANSRSGRHWAQE